MHCTKQLVSVWFLCYFHYHHAPVNSSEDKLHTKQGFLTNNNYNSNNHKIKKSKQDIDNAAFLTFSTVHLKIMIQQTEPYSTLCQNVILHPQSLSVFKQISQLASLCLGFGFSEFSQSETSNQGKRCSVLHRNCKNCKDCKTGSRPCQGWQATNGRLWVYRPFLCVCWRVSERHIASECGHLSVQVCVYLPQTDWFGS